MGFLFNGVPKIRRNRDFFPTGEFTNSSEYWEKRYVSGGNSGGGSFGELAEYKADTLNKFVRDQNITSVIDFGCGDGNNLALFEFPLYIGVDVSETALKICRKKFKDDFSKAFISSRLLTGSITAELAISLDVIYHLVEDEIYSSYMSDLTASASRFIIFYSSNVEQSHPSPHIKHRKIQDWMDLFGPAWQLVEQQENPFKSDLIGRHSDKSFANFYVYKKLA